MTKTTAIARPKRLPKGSSFPRLAALAALVLPVAATWLAAAVPAVERAALIAIYNSTNGDGWTNNSNWKTPPLDTDGFAMPGTEGTWLGVGVASDHVQGLDLYDNQQTGSIPAEIGNLTSLQTLYLSKNQLTGSIPPELGNLTVLYDLHLDTNELTGNIPATLGNLTGLLGLSLNSNQLSGSIPPELGNLTHLEFLYLYDNQLSGNVPATLGNLTGLKYLYLDSNQLTGSIPPELGNLVSLVDLGLSSNRLSGSIPPELGNLTHLEYLFLEHSQLTGGIPAELGNLASLQNLSLDSNQLTGSIPPELGSLTILDILSLDNNRLSGSIPPELGNFTHLGYLYLGNNQLTGSIPPELGNLTELRVLQLNGNQLSGSIPTELGNLTKLSSGWTDLRWNALYTSDATLRAFLDSKQNGGNWEGTQTVVPTGVAAGSPSDSSLTVTWTPIGYTGDTGGYRVMYAQSSGGPYALYGTTADKSASSLVVTGLAPSAGYYFVVQAFTEPHDHNRNTVESETSTPPAFGTTSAGVPPSIAVSPAGAALCSGQRATLTVTATGTGTLHYTWYRGVSGYTGTPAIVSKDSPSYKTPPLLITSLYWVRVSNDYGHADSDTAFLTRITSTAIAQGPDDAAVPPGGQTALNVKAKGESLTFQWYRGSSGDISDPVEGATQARLDTPPRFERTRYWVRVQGDCGTADSAAATVWVGGDVNGDGVVDGEDLALLRQFLTDDLPPGAPFDRAAADLDGDGRVDTVDLTILSSAITH